MEAANSKFWMLDRSAMRDYMLLTVALSLGVAGSIFVFIAGVNYSSRDAHYKFQHEVDGLTGEINLQFRNFALNFELLGEVLLSQPNKNLEKDLQWLESRVGNSKFTCLFVQKLDLKRQLIERTTMVRATEPWCEKLGQNFSDWDANRATKNSHAYITVKPIVDLDHTYLKVIRSSATPGSLLTAVVSLNTLLPQKYDHSIEARIDGIGELGPVNAHTGSDANSESKVVLVPFLGNSARFIFTPKDREFRIDMRWPWALFLLCLFFVILMTVFLYSIINKNRIVTREVLARTADLKRATDEAQKANHTKSRFLANVSHEIRTPLNLILGMADLLSETKIDEEQRDYISSFQRAGQHLLEVITDILDIAQVEAGNSKAQIESVNLIELLQSVSNTVAVSARKRKLHYRHVLSPTLPRYVKTDAKRLRQVLINLLNNATKFTYEGEVSLQASYEEGTLRFAVSDTGIGIAEVDQSKVFEEFYQVDSSSKRKNPGVGLGLSIVQNCLEILGGTIDLQSHPGVGTDFTLQIPVESEGEPWLNVYKDKKPFQKILTLGLQTGQLSFLRENLNYIGIQIDSLSHLRGLERKLRENPVASDLVMINLEGHGGEPAVTLEQLGSADLEMAKVIAVLPLSHRKDDLVRLRQLGITKVIFAPIDLDKLLCRFSSDSLQEKVSPPPPPAKAFTLSQNTSILIAEDDADNQFLIKSYLKALDSELELQFAGNGKDALRLYNSSERCDVLITDIQMPIMDGLELIEEVRKYEKENSVPATKIIALTADAQAEQKIRVLSSGADEYVTKPIGKVQLLDTIRKVLGP